jgi:CRP-like cAMP-binding protein
MPHQNNQLLARFGPLETEALRPELRTVTLDHGQVLADTHRPIETTYFPYSGILSFVVALQNGMAIETGMVGRDGEFGAANALDGKVSLNRVIVQVPGLASAINSDRLRTIADRLPNVRAMLIKYELFFVAQVQQTAACNAAHDVHTRMCKWLLRMHELVGVDLPLTQEFLAQMMGVQRTSVSGVASQLQKEGLITYRRGHIHIENLAMVRSHACECHQDIGTHFEKIFAEPIKTIHLQPASSPDFLGS